MAPQLLAMVLLILQPAFVSRALYVPDSSNNPYWLALNSGDYAPGSGPDWNDDGTGVPGWYSQFQAAVDSGAISWWGGGNFYIDGALASLSAQYHLPVGDADSDGIPDDLDSYQNDPTNNTFYWGGGSFTLAGSPYSFPGGYYAGLWMDTDGDGIPDSLDPYQLDSNNNNNNSMFWWDGGGFTVDNQSVTFPAQYYSGGSGDSDYDGIPDGADPYPSDSNNGNTVTVWWSGGIYMINGVSTNLEGQAHSPYANDSDTDGIPDDIDPYPNDATNNSFWWGGGTFTINNTSNTFYPQYYAGTSTDSDGDEIPDTLDPYLSDATNNTSYWGGGTFLINGEWSTFAAQYYAGLPIDTDADSIPDALDPYPNDDWNNTRFSWEGGEFVVDGAASTIAGATYNGFWSDVDSDGIPDVADPYPNDSSNNTANWNGGTFLVAGNWISYVAQQHRADAGDTDNDGIPNDLDPYPNDGGNNTFYWQGGTFTVNDTSVSFGAQYYTGDAGDSDSDGIPNGLDLYPTDSNNGNTANQFWWGGGTFTINGTETYLSSGWYSGAWADADGDSIPDSADPYPNDSANNTTSSFYWGGGSFTVNNVSTEFSPATYSGVWSDIDGDSIPDPADPYPTDANNNNGTSYWFGGGTYCINGVDTWVAAQFYSGTDGDIDTDGLPDGVDPYPNDGSNNTAQWAGGSYMVDGQATTFPAANYAANAGDGDSDGIPDPLDPYPNDAYNHSFFQWPAQVVTFLIGNQSHEFSPTLYPLPYVDSDSDGIPDGADPYPTDGTNGNDTDGDGIPDAVELQYALNPNNASDAQVVRADGLTNLQAYQNGLALDAELMDTALDSDEDQMKDVYEIVNGLNRFDNRDAVDAPMNDFVFNFEKAQHALAVTAVVAAEDYETITGHALSTVTHDPEKSVAENDWDGDGVSNVDEVLVFGTDPRNSASLPRSIEIRRALIEQRASLTTRSEFLWMVDGGPTQDADSDQDGIPDWYEVLINTDPTKTSTLDDGIPDGWKIVHDFDPLDASVATADPDGDGLTNLQEYLAGTDPRVPDILLSISLSRMSHLLKVVTATGETFDLEHIQEQGFDSFDDDGQPAWYSSGYFTATSHYAPGKNWWVYDYTAGQSAPVKNANLISWTYTGNTGGGSGGSGGTWVDSDYDGLSDAQEIALGTNPNDADSDDDGINDGNDANPKTWDAPAGWDAMKPVQAYAQQIGLTNAVELQWTLTGALTTEQQDLMPLGSYRVERQMDGGEWTVVAEIAVDSALDPSLLDRGFYTNAGLVPGHSYIYRVSLFHSTTSAGGAQSGSVALIFDPDGDFDGDGLTNAIEAVPHTDPTSADSDGDGFSDAYEVGFGSSPTDSSSFPGGGGSGGSGGGGSGGSGGSSSGNGRYGDDNSVLFTSHRERFLTFRGYNSPNWPYTIVPDSGGGDTHWKKFLGYYGPIPGKPSDEIDGDAQGDNYEHDDPRDQFPPIPRREVWDESDTYKEGYEEVPPTSSEHQEPVAGSAESRSSGGWYHAENAYMGDYKAQTKPDVAGNPEFDAAKARAILDNIPYGGKANVPEGTSGEGWQGMGYRGPSNYEVMSSWSESTTTVTNPAPVEEDAAPAEDWAFSADAYMSAKEVRLESNKAVEANDPMEATFLLLKVTENLPIPIEDPPDPVVDVIGTITLVIPSGKISTQQRVVGTLPSCVTVGNGVIKLAPPEPVANKAISLKLLPFEIFADTNRDGKTDVQDLRARDEWTKDRGALYTTNFDGDDGRTDGQTPVPDAIDFEPYEGKPIRENFSIDSSADEEDITPLVIKDMKDLPSNAHVILKVHEKEDIKAVHVFKRIKRGETAIWGALTEDQEWEDGIDITKWTNPNSPEYEETRDDVAQDYVFGIEGLLLRGMDVPDNAGSMDGRFSGEILFKLQITSDNDPDEEPADRFAEDRAKLRVAPWLMIENSQPPETTYVVNTTEYPSTSEFAAPFSATVPSTAVSPREAGNRWLQDHVEIGYMQRPGGPKTWCAFQLPYATMAEWSQSSATMPAWGRKTLLKKDSGIFTLGYKNLLTPADTGGNLELLPPNDTFPLGRVAQGAGVRPRMRQFLDAQAMQPALAEIDTSWLAVGHIDELFSFLASGSVAVASPTVAYQLLDALPAESRARAVFFTGSTQVPVVGIVKEVIPDDTHATLGKLRFHAAIPASTNWSYLRVYEGPGAGQVLQITNPVLRPDGRYEVDVLAIFDTGSTILPVAGSGRPCLKTCMESGAPSGSLPGVTARIVLTGDSLWRSKTIDGNPSVTPMIFTAKELLDDQSFRQLNLDVYSPIIGDARTTIANEGGGAIAFAELPALFIPISRNGAPEKCESFAPNPTNLQVANGVCVLPKQFSPVTANATDLFEDDVKTKIFGSFVPNWYTYHVKDGEVHCGTNVRRTIPDKWWKKIPASFTE